MSRKHWFAQARRSVEDHFSAKRDLDPIPKVFHLTFPKEAELPPALVANLEGMKSRNPDWELRVYDDAEAEAFLESVYGPAVVRIYRSIDPVYGAARADLFRYLCVYHWGGAYFDIKSSPTRPMDLVLRSDDRFLLSQWKFEKDSEHAHWGRHRILSSIPGGEYQQWFLVAAAGHPFLKAVILQVFHNLEVYNPLPWKVGRTGVLTTTGPIAFTLAIEPLRPLHPHRMVNSWEDCGFLYSVFLDRSLSEHRVMFSKPHYSRVTQPLIPVAWPVRWALRCCLAVRSVLVLGRSVAKGLQKRLRH